MGPDPGRLPGSEPRAPRPALPALGPCLPGRGVGAPAGLQAKSKCSFLEEGWFFKLSTFKSQRAHIKGQIFAKRLRVSLPEPSSQLAELSADGHAWRPHGQVVSPPLVASRVAQGVPPASGTSTAFSGHAAVSQEPAHVPAAHLAQPLSSQPQQFGRRLPGTPGDPEAWRPHSGCAAGWADPWLPGRLSPARPAAPAARAQVSGGGPE